MLKSRRIGITPWRCLHRTLQGAPGSQAVINFNDTAVAFRSKTLYELTRAKVVFTACQVKTLVKNSEALIRTSYKVAGMKITNSVLRWTFFGHFCAGEDEKLIKPTVDYLQRNGIGSILDYAAEADVEETPANEPVKNNQKNELQGRVYEYKDEQMCDMHLETFQKCIYAVKSVSPTGFAAIKCTALGNPKLLERMSTTIVELRKLFLMFDKSNTGFVTREDFAEAYNKFFTGGSVDSIFDKIDVDHDGKVDYIEWTNGLPIEDLGDLIKLCREKGPLAKAALDANEVKLVKQMRERIYKLAKLAKDLGVRLMIDAEHTYFQPAIDNITVDLAKKYNNDYPVIFSTYQMYLKDSRQRLKTDIERAKKGNYKFAAKLVRGAYMVLERQRAKDLGYEDPINDTLDATHRNYNGAIKEVLQAMVSSNNQIEIMVASHNQQSVELTLQVMNELGLPPSAGVYFGQLLGMSDHLTFSLGNNGYKAYKYVPYGKINEVMPYLIRRAQENSGALSGAKVEIDMINSEIKRRLFSKKL